MGVSWNKVLAKLGSDYKKPDAVTVIDRSNFKSLVWPLPASDLLMVGHSTSARLRRMAGSMSSRAGKGRAATVSLVSGVIQ